MPRSTYRATPAGGSTAVLETELLPRNDADARRRLPGFCPMGRRCLVSSRNGASREFGETGVGGIDQL
jgi:hypothetical protein